MTIKIDAILLRKLETVQGRTQRLPFPTANSDPVLQTVPEIPNPDEDREGINPGVITFQVPPEPPEPPRIRVLVKA